MVIMNYCRQWEMMLYRKREGCWIFKQGLFFGPALRFCRCCWWTNFHRSACNKLVFPKPPTFPARHNDEFCNWFSLRRRRRHCSALPVCVCVCQSESSECVHEREFNTFCDWRNTSHQQISAEWSMAHSRAAIIKMRQNINYESLF